MILGFAHITCNHQGNGAFPIPNAPQKWPLMERKATRHQIDLRLKYTVPEEVVAYDTGVVDQHLNRLDVCRDRIILSARDPRAEMEFFIRGLGLRNGVTWIGIDGPVRKWNVKILVAGDAVAPLDPPLDVAGYTALAFYSTDVEEDCKRAVASGGKDPTEPFTVSLDRDMDVVMLRSPEGTIVELIQVRP